MAAKDRKCATCANFIYRDNKTGKCGTCLHEAVKILAPTPAVAVEEDREKNRLKADLKDYKQKYEASLKLIESQDAQLGWLEAIRQGVDTTYRIQPREGLGTSEVTPVILASDWHSEEIVKAAQVNGLNEFNLEIFDRRCTRFWQSVLRLVRMFNKDVTISTVVIGLLGDFITNDIQDAENAENNALLPIDAIINVQNHIIAGFDFLLNNTTYDFVIVCKVGNHSRTTKKVRSASELGHSLETMMYVHLAAYYRSEPRMKFVIEDGYHTYLDIYDKTLRIHHGHALRYDGGVGGLYIPARKACAQWNKGRKADRDLFGHFHQHLNDSMFTCNGSLIGYNSFAVRIKADFEEPQQALVMVDKKRGFTGRWPIFLDK